MALNDRMNVKTVPFKKKKEDGFNKTAPQATQQLKTLLNTVDMLK